MFPSPQTFPPILPFVLGEQSVSGTIGVFFNGIRLRSLAVFFTTPTLMVTRSETTSESERFIVGKPPVITQTREASRQEIARTGEATKVTEA